MSNLLVYLSPVQIISRVEARAIKADGVERLRAKINRLGFQADKPIRVYPYESGYRLIDGSHRLQAAIAEGLESIPALVVEPPATELEAIKQARESNEASETVVPTTFVDDAELIWRMLKDNTQQEVATALGWSRTVIADYKQLSKICLKAWQIIVATFEVNGDTKDYSEATENVAMATSPFTERLLREIVTLNPRQQFDLVSRLASEEIPGWVNKPLDADYIAYAVLPVGQAVLMPVPQVQKAWSIYSKEWQEKYFIAAAKNRGYITHSVCVPLGVVFASIGSGFRAKFKPIQPESTTHD